MNELAELKIASLVGELDQVGGERRQRRLICTASVAIIVAGASW